MGSCSICHKSLLRDITKDSRPDKQRKAKIKYGDDKQDTQQHSHSKEGQILAAKCGHLFHKQCLLHYLSAFKGATSMTFGECPMCQQKISLSSTIFISFDGNKCHTDITEKDLSTAQAKNQELEGQLKIVQTKLAETLSYINDGIRLCQSLQAQECNLKGQLNPGKSLVEECKEMHETCAAIKEENIVMANVYLDMLSNWKSNNLEPFEPVPIKLRPHLRTIQECPTLLKRFLQIIVPIPFTMDKFGKIGRNPPKEELVNSIVERVSLLNKEPEESEPEPKSSESDILTEDAYIGVYNYSDSCVESEIQSLEPVIMKSSPLISPKAPAAVPISSPLDILEPELNIKDALSSTLQDPAPVSISSSIRVSEPQLNTKDALSSPLQDPASVPISSSLVILEPQLNTKDALSSTLQDLASVPISSSLVTSEPQLNTKDDLLSTPLCSASVPISSLLVISKPQLNTKYALSSSPQSSAPSPPISFLPAISESEHNIKDILLSSPQTSAPIHIPSLAAIFDPELNINNSVDASSVKTTSAQNRLSPVKPTTQELDFCLPNQLEFRALRQLPIPKHLSKETLLEKTTCISKPVFLNNEFTKSPKAALGISSQPDPTTPENGVSDLSILPNLVDLASHLALESSAQIASLLDRSNGPELPEQPTLILPSLHDHFSSLPPPSVKTSEEYLAEELTVSNPIQEQIGDTPLSALPPAQFSNQISPNHEMSPVVHQTPKSTNPRYPENVVTNNRVGKNIIWPTHHEPNILHGHQHQFKKSDSGEYCSGYNGLSPFEFEAANNPNSSPWFHNLPLGFHCHQEPQRHVHYHLHSNELPAMTVSPLPLIPIPVLPPLSVQTSGNYSLLNQELALANLDPIDLCGDASDASILDWIPEPPENKEGLFKKHEKIDPEVALIITSNQTRHLKELINQRPVCKARKIRKPF